MPALVHPVTHTHWHQAFYVSMFADMLHPSATETASTTECCCMNLEVVVFVVVCSKKVFGALDIVR